MLPAKWLRRLLRVLLLLDVLRHPLLERLDLVEVDVRVLAALALVVLDPSPLPLQPLGLVPDRLAKRRVLVAVRVAQDTTRSGTPRTLA
jgi:hypothetical protein